MNIFYEFKDENKNKDSYINFFITKIYGWMSIGLALTSFVSWYVTKIPILINFIYFNQLCLLTIIIIQMFLVYLISNMIFKLNKNTIIFSFLMYSILNGLTLSGIFFIYTFSSIFSIFLITSIIFILMTIYGLITNKDLTSFGSLLLMLLFGSLVSTIVNVFMKNTLLMYILSYINIFIFIGVISYDTQKLKNLGNNLYLVDQYFLSKYIILGALILYLDFLNLFLSLIKIINKKIIDNKDN